MPHPQLSTQQTVQTPPPDEGSGPATWLNKQRVKLNTKLLGHQPSTMKEDKPTYREQFVPPEMSILAYLLQRVSKFIIRTADFEMIQTCDKTYCIPSKKGQFLNLKYIS